MVALYALVYFIFGWVRYAGHRNFVDLGIFAQTAASAFGCFCNAIEGSHWAFHFSPILYPIGALVQVWHSALALIAVQALAGALTAPPVYGLVRRRADRKAALLAAIVVLLYPPLGGAIFNDFHENGLAPAAVAWLLWAFDGGYAGLTLLFAALTLAVKEDQGLFLAIAGAIASSAYRRDALRSRLAWVIAVAGAAVFLLFFVFIQPYANVGAHWAPLRFFGAASWSVRDILARVGFLALAFVPLLFVPFRTWAIVIAIAPLAEVLASSMATTYTMGSHYAGEWAGYVFFAFAIGIGAIARADVHRAHRVLYWCIGLCVVEFAVADPLHPGYFLRAPQARDSRLNTVLRTLPSGIDLATQEEAFTHLAATDPHVTLLPELPQNGVRACYILIDRDYPDSVRLIESRLLLQTLTASRAYVAVLRDAGISLYRSRLCSVVNPRLRPPR